MSMSPGKKTLMSVARPNQLQVDCATQPWPSAPRVSAFAHLRGWAAPLMLAILAALCAPGCTLGLRSAVTLHVARAKTTPRDASVYIDDEFIGPLYYVAAHGVRVPTGKHRISITKDGYFPWDRLVEADRQPISLEVGLVRIPD